MLVMPRLLSDVGGVLGEIWEPWTRTTSSYSSYSVLLSMKHAHSLVPFFELNRTYAASELI